METPFVLLAAITLTGAVYLLMSRALVRMLLGVILLGNAINLMIFAAGRMTRAVPPIVAAGDSALVSGAANPLPQALILTAIVIGFSVFAFLMVLAFRTYKALDADNTDHLRLAEPEGEPNPPLDY